MNTEIKLAAEDIQSAYERLTNAFTMANENKDAIAYKLQDVLNILAQCMSHVNGIVDVMFPEPTATDTSSNDVPVMGRSNKNATRGN